MRNTGLWAQTVTAVLIGSSALTLGAAVVSFNNSFDNGGGIGLMAGGDLFKPQVNTNPSAQIGSNASDNNTWGTGSTAGKTGPDIGSTWRGAVCIRASFILNADTTDTLSTPADLTSKVTSLALTLNVTAKGSATTASYAPNVYFRGIKTETNPSAGYWSAWEDATLNASSANTVAGFFDDRDDNNAPSVGDAYVFGFAGPILGAANTTDFISFGVVGNKNAVANESLTFGNGVLEVYTSEGQVISVNFAIADSDNNSVEGDETAGIAPALGRAWNHVIVATGADVTPTLIHNKVIALHDDHGMEDRDWDKSGCCQQRKRRGVPELGGIRFCHRS